jgi:hypothetical protein
VQAFCRERVTTRFAVFYGGGDRAPFLSVRLFGVRGAEVSPRLATRAAPDAPSGPGRLSPTASEPPVARFLAVSGPLHKAMEAVLGTNPFETDPAATLALLDLPREGYERHAQFEKGGVWEPVLAKSTDESKRKTELAKNIMLATTLRTLRWTAEPGEVLTYDGLDGPLCHQGTWSEPGGLRIRSHRRRS